MPLLQADVAMSSGGSYPTISRLTVATLPTVVATSTFALVTDGSATVNQSGITPVGGGSLLNLVWWNGFNWVVV
jgi:hypothetical protein